MLKLRLIHSLQAAKWGKAVRSVDYNTRRKSILSSAINRYIKNAVPVASEDMADEFELSSATIRNI
ncbi:MAG: hypothetical protein PHR73_05865, partial [Candidatus Omnitrophica bacterium]|nr:hypothetical protein [Candidatus Omnitrophota bacterium]